MRNLCKMDVPSGAMRDAIPTDRLNERLSDMGAIWRVQTDKESLKFLEVGKGATRPGAENGSNGTSDTAPEQNPMGRIAPTVGIALIFCEKIDGPKVAGNSTCPRNLIGTFDMWDFESFPHECGPFHAYVLIAGCGSVELTLSLTAPTEEILFEKTILAENWAEIGTFEVPLLVGKLLVPRPGIYHWKLCRGDKVLLERPMLFRLRMQQPALP